MIMMKIVDEIVLAVGDGRQWPAGTVNAGELESIIAAKLEPVRKALKSIIECEQDTSPGRQTSVENIAEMTLALFEDE